MLLSDGEPNARRTSPSDEPCATPPTAPVANKSTRDAMISVTVTLARAASRRCGERVCSHLSAARRSPDGWSECHSDKVNAMGCSEVSGAGRVPWRSRRRDRRLRRGRTSPHAGHRPNRNSLAAGRRPTLRGRGLRGERGAANVIRVLGARLPVRRLKRCRPDVQPDRHSTPRRQAGRIEHRLARRLPRRSCRLKILRAIYRPGAGLPAD